VVLNRRSWDFLKTPVRPAAWSTSRYLGQRRTWRKAGNLGVGGWIFRKIWGKPWVPGENMGKSIGQTYGNHRLPTKKVQKR